MVQELKKNGVLELDNKIPSTITAFGPGYIDADNEVIVGLQTDKPLKRAIKPIGMRDAVFVAWALRGAQVGHCS